MRVPKHEEYTIYVRAPYNREGCLFGLETKRQCRNDGDFALTIRNDRDHIIVEYANICSMHMLMTILDNILN